MRFAPGGFGGAAGIVSGGVRLTVELDGMRVDWDVPIEMDDGVILRADVFRPLDDTPVPVLLTYGPYGKGMRFSEHHPEQWERLIKRRPEVLVGSTNKYQAWETPDPERWIPHGYACVRVDSRGAGRSPGFFSPNSPREYLDASQCVDWAGTQAWSNGRVGMLGISYYAANSWRVAGLEHPSSHLAAICAWEGNSDAYRDRARHGGILTTWPQHWRNSRLLPMQHGYGERGERNPNNGELVAGPITLSDDELAANRSDAAPTDPLGLDSDFWKARSVNFDNVKVPVLSAANWGGAALHLRGNIEGFTRAASADKWLEVHGLEHWTHFYSSYGLDLQRRFFARFLKGDASGWPDQPRVLLNVRHPGEVFELRGETDWPLPGTEWTRFYLDLSGRTLTTAVPTGNESVQFDALGDGVRFLSDPVRIETEITGPAAAKLFISSTTIDADIFLVLHVFDPAGKEITFQGAMDPQSSVGKGWLRASHRKLDQAITRPERPYHTHDEIQPLEPGETYELDVEIWPTSIVVPVGYRIGLSVMGKDYFRIGEPWEGTYESFGQHLNRFGCGAMVHDDPVDRPDDVFGGQTTISADETRRSYLLLPIIPTSRPNPATTVSSSES